MIYVYCLKQNDDILYVGLTKNPSERERVHSKTKPLPHNFEILEKIENVLEASEREIDLIKQYKTIEEGWNISPGGDYSGNSGYNRKGIGGVKRGTVPWNKGKKNCFSEETINNFKKKRKGVIHSSKLSESEVKNILDHFNNHPIIDGVGKKASNGKILTQERAFANMHHEKYKISNINLYNIVSRKSWSKIN